MTTKQDAIKILGLYFLVMLSTIGVQFLLVPLFESQLEEQAFAITFNTGLNLLIYLVLTIGFAYFFRHIFRFDFQLSKEDISETVKYVAIGFGVMILFVIAASLIYQYFGITETSANQASLDVMFENGRTIDWIFLGIFTIFLAPIVEEFVFRKAIIGFFSRSLLSTTIAIIFSGLAFGYIHVASAADYEQIIYYALIGMVLALFYVLSKYNIYVPILMHLIFNGFLVSMMFVQLAAV